MVYLYDGSYAGLLSTLHRIFSCRERPDDITSNPTAGGLFDHHVDSPTDPVRAEKLHRAIKEHLSPNGNHNIRMAFLSERPGIELAIYNYLDLGWKLRRRLDHHLSHEAVYTIHKWARRTGHEAHRLKGLLRFRETADGLFYAPLEPDANIVPLITPHFARRLTDRQWLIHDVRRNIGALYNGKNWVLGKVELAEKPVLSEAEKEWQTLWRTFFDHIAIAERRNPKLQKQFMPMKYWKYLVEV